MGRSHGERLLFFATLRVARFCWQCLLEGRLGPPFLSHGEVVSFLLAVPAKLAAQPRFLSTWKESAAGG